jgi:peroxin-19
MSKNDQDAVEAALVAALSELDNESDGEEDDAITQSQQQKIEEPPTIARSSSSNTTATSKVKFGPPLPPANDTNCKLRLSNLMETMLTVSDESEGGDAVDSEDVMMKAILQQMQSQLAQHDTSNDNSEQPSSSETMSHSDLDDAIEKMVHNMAIQASLNDDTNQSTNTTFSPDTSGAAELLEALKGLEIGIGDVDWNADAVIDGMMEQLLSKDFMYEPIKQVAERFPQWLEENQPYLPEKEYQACVFKMQCC